MKKTLASLIDELTITNIKIYVLKQVKKAMREPVHSIKIQKLNKYRKKLHKGLNSQVSLKMSIAEIIDVLTITNIKIFMLVDKVHKNEHTRLEAKKIQDLNKYRSELVNALNKIFKQRQDIKV